MKEILNDLIDIIHLSPSRQAQIYFDAEIDLSKKTITFVTSTEYYLKSRTGSGIRLPIGIIAESSFHIGLVVGCLEEWLTDNNIKYILDEKYTSNFIETKVILT
jgi:hypothetical protein